MACGDATTAGRRRRAADGACQVHARFSAELARHGAGALLFWPTTPSGAGYYLAAWAVSDADDELVEDDEDGEARAPVLARSCRWDGMARRL
jgi:hypothetical protein